MSSTETIEQATEAPLEEARLLAHYGTLPRQTPEVALCGKRLIGVQAPPDAPFCVVCEQLWREGSA